MFITLAGNPSGTPVIQVPTGVRAWIITNSLGVSATVQMASGAGATVANGATKLVASNGSAVVAL
jgi:hypothetical protein